MLLLWQTCGQILNRELVLWSLLQDHVCGGLMKVCCCALPAMLGYDVCQTCFDKDHLPKGRVYVTYDGIKEED